VAAAAFAPIPRSSIQQGIVQRPQVIAVELRRLLEQAQVPSSTAAVVGIPSDGLAVRALNLPPTPDDDLAQVVEGEVDHYRILRTKGSHSFVVLNPPVKPTPGSPRTVIVAAAEEQVTGALGTVIADAGLKLHALEPLEFGMLRSAAAGIPNDQPAFVVLIGENSTDLAAFSKGQLWSYRRVESGASQIIASVRRADTFEVYGPTDIVPAGANALVEFSDPVVDLLCREIGTSIAYLGREYKDAAQFAKVYVSVGTQLLADLGPTFSNKIGLPVEVVPPFSSTGKVLDVVRQIEDSESMRYTAAFGLAIRELSNVSGAIPRVDLYAAERARAEGQEIRRNLTGSFLISAASGLIGVIGFLLYQHQYSGIEAQTKKLNAHASALQQEISAVTEKHASRERQANLLAQGGINPLATIDSIASCIEPGVGIQSLNVDPTRTVSMTAEAKDEPSMLATFGKLQGVPLLVGANLQTFNNKDGGGLTFTVAAKTLSATEVQIGGAPAPSLSATNTAQAAPANNAPLAQRKVTR
jgi:Tfp pilus assembly PilM family ATPase